MNALYVRLLRVGVRTIKPGERHWAVRHDRRDLSLFQSREIAASGAREEACMTL